MRVRILLLHTVVVLKEQSLALVCYSNARKLTSYSNTDTKYTSAFVNLGKISTVISIYPMSKKMDYSFILKEVPYPKKYMFEL